MGRGGRKDCSDECCEKEFLGVTAARSGWRQIQVEASPRRPRRFFVGLVASSVDRDLFFQDSHVVLGWGFAAAITVVEPFHRSSSRVPTRFTRALGSSVTRGHSWTQVYLLSNF